MAEDTKMYFIFIECEYKKGWLSSQEHSEKIRDKYWYQYVTEWNPTTEEFDYSDGDVDKIITKSQPPIYFNSLEEAKEVAKIVRVYSIIEDIECSIYAKYYKNNVLNWKMYVSNRKKSYRIH